MITIKSTKAKVGFVAGLVLAAFVSGLVLADAPKASIVDPDAGRPEAERRAAQEAHFKAFWTEYEKWIVDQNAKDLDLRSLPAYDLLASYAGPSLTLTDAAQRADRWISGEVEDLTFLPTGSTEIQIRVTAGSKTLPGTLAKVEFPGGLRPAEDWSPTLGVAEAAPLVFAGERVVLLVEADPATGALMPEMWTGVFRTSASGKIVALAQNPFAKALEKGSAQDLEQLLSAAFRSEGP